MSDFWNKIFNRIPHFRIDSLQSLALASEKFGVLPFFPNQIRGLSVQEMCAPGLLFGGNQDEGCWEWKGPVIRQKVSAYGKFFNRKVGFVSLSLFPYFLNYRRAKYPVKPDSTEAMILDIIRENDGMTSTELKKYIFGERHPSRKWNDIPDKQEYFQPNAKRKSLEGPLQRLQMGGWLIISDFEYKMTRKGERYGWGVARYSTPELQFGDNLPNLNNLSPEDSLKIMIKEIKSQCVAISEKTIKSLLS